MNEQLPFQQELAEDGSPSGVEADTPIVNNEPFDPQSISISSKTIALDTVLRRIKNNTIRLAPDFQRSFVWDSDRRSLLIESMMLKIPLPMFYVAEDEDGIWEVVDGLQRLTTIKNFILGDEEGNKHDFKLSGLEFWGKEFDGLSYSDIEQKPDSSRIINNIMETELSFTIINPGTPEKVKRNIFRRINTGGMPLSDQEIRHALYQGEATDLLKKLVNSKPFKDATQETVKDDRMAARELITRFLAFYLLKHDNFKGDTDDYLSTVMKLLNGEKDTENLSRFTTQEIATMDIYKLFSNTQKRCLKIFGKHCFRKSIFTENKSPINKSLFELWSVFFLNITTEEFSKIEEDKNSFLTKYSCLLKDEEFLNSISRHSSSPSRGIKIRYSKIERLLKEFIEND